MKLISARELQKKVFLKDLQHILDDIELEKDDHYLDNKGIIFRIKDYDTGEIWDGNDLNVSPIITPDGIIFELVKIKS